MTSNDVDTTSSASSQHYIETGEYLKKGEALSLPVLPTVTEEETRTLFVHDKAGEVITAMFLQCEKIKATYGPYDEYVKAITSLHWCLDKLMTRTGFGRKAWVTKEHDDIGLSLFVQEEHGFVFGIVWSRDRSQDGTDREGIAGDWSCHS